MDICRIKYCVRTLSLLEEKVIFGHPPKNLYIRLSTGRTGNASISIHEMLSFHLGTECCNY